MIHTLIRSARYNTRQISAGDYGTKSGVSRGGIERLEQSKTVYDLENLPRRMRLISVEERAYLLGGQIRMIHRTRHATGSASSRRQKIMCASVKASSRSRPQTLPSTTAEGNLSQGWEREVSTGDRWISVVPCRDFRLVYSVYI